MRRRIRQLRKLDSLQRFLVLPRRNLGVRIVYNVIDIYGLGIGFGADHRAEEVFGNTLHTAAICSPTKYAALRMASALLYVHNRAQIGIICCHSGLAIEAGMVASQPITRGMMVGGENRHHGCEKMPDSVFERETLRI